MKYSRGAGTSCQSRCTIEGRSGDVAQLGERYNRTVEVGGSNPPVSTPYSTSQVSGVIKSLTSILMPPDAMGMLLDVAPNQSCDTRARRASGSTRIATLLVRCSTQPRPLGSERIRGSWMDSRSEADMRSLTWRYGRSQNGAVAGVGAGRPAAVCAANNRSSASPSVSCRIRQSLVFSTAVSSGCKSPAHRSSPKSVPRHLEYGDYLRSRRNARWTTTSTSLAAISRAPRSSPR